MDRPGNTAGLHHVALAVQDLEACEEFYAGVLGMQVEWRPDPDNLYLTSGSDNLALHRTSGNFAPQRAQRLDHIGFILATADEVDAWCEYLGSHGVEIKSSPRTHRDGARSFYCQDPDGNVVQMIYHPPLASISPKGKNSG